MRIIAVLDVDEEKLVRTGHSFEEEMGWTAESGITLTSYTDTEKCSTYEYAAFAWNKEKEEYAQIGGGPLRQSNYARTGSKNVWKKGSWRHAMILGMLYIRNAAYQSYMTTGQVWNSWNIILCRQLRTMGITERDTMPVSLFPVSI